MSSALREIWTYFYNPDTKELLKPDKVSTGYTFETVYDDSPFTEIHPALNPILFATKDTAGRARELLVNWLVDPNQTKFYTVKIIEQEAYNRRGPAELSLEVSRSGNVKAELNAGLIIWTLLSQGEYWSKQQILAEIAN